MPGVANISFIILVALLKSYPLTETRIINKFPKYTAMKVKPQKSDNVSPSLEMILLVLKKIQVFK